jgi:hypothetical protein
MVIISVLETVDIKSFLYSSRQLGQSGEISAPWSGQSPERRAAGSSQQQQQKAASTENLSRLTGEPRRRLEMRQYLGRTTHRYTR